MNVHELEQQEYEENSRFDYLSAMREESRQLSLQRRHDEDLLAIEEGWTLIPQFCESACDEHLPDCEYDVF